MRTRDLVLLFLTIVVVFFPVSAVRAVTLKRNVSLEYSSRSPVQKAEKPLSLDELREVDALADQCKIDEEKTIEAMELKQARDAPGTKLHFFVPNDDGEVTRDRYKNWHVADCVLSKACGDKLLSHYCTPVQ